MLDESEIDKIENSLKPGEDTDDIIIKKYKLDIVYGGFDNGPQQWFIGKEYPLVGDGSWIYADLDPEGLIKWEKKSSAKVEQQIEKLQNAYGFTQYAPGWVVVSSYG